MTLDQMVSLIMSDVGSGLKEVGNYPYTVDLVKAEISAARSDLIMQLSDSGKLNRQHLAQRIDNIELDFDKFPVQGFVDSEQPVLTAQIPKLAMTADNKAIIYMGPPDMSLNLKTYFDINDLKSHKYSRVIKNRPHAFIDQAQDYEGDFQVYLFNLGPAPFRYLTIHAIFDDPVRIMQSDGYYIDDDEFPAPLAMQRMIIRDVVNRIRALYREYGGQNEPNDQTDKI